MQRREFITSIAAATAAMGVLPRAAAAASEAIEALHRDVAGNDDMWPRIRKEFMLKRGLAHLNCGSLGACPRLVVDGDTGFQPVYSKCHRHAGSPCHSPEHLQELCETSVSPVQITQWSESSVTLRCEVSVPSRTSSQPLPLRDIWIRQQQQVCTFVSGPRSARQIAKIEPPWATMSGW